MQTAWSRPAEIKPSDVGLKMLGRNKAQINHLPTAMSHSLWACAEGC